MEIKTLEVKNISHYERGTEETPCYNATVYINGKKAIEVSNDGHGGCDDYYKNYNDAKRDADEWKAKGYDDVIIEEIKNGN